MGREVRRVPPDWKHPEQAGALFASKPREEIVAEIHEWLAQQLLWSRGAHPDQDPDCYSYTKWAGGPPNPDDYMPHWPAEVATHYMMYETTSEGTPVSPAFGTPEELARYCTEHVSWFSHMKAPYEHWLKIAQGGWAPDCVITIPAGGDDG